MLKVAITSSSRLSSSESYKNHMNAINVALENDIKNNNKITIRRSKEILEQEPEYQLVLDSNQLIRDIDEAISQTHRFVCDIYGKKFPELEGLNKYA